MMVKLQSIYSNNIIKLLVLISFILMFVMNVYVLIISPDK